MASFKAVLVEHGYASTACERDIITRVGGEFVDADSLPLPESLRLCADADAVMVRRIVVTRELMSQFRRCRILLRYGVGVDNVDLAAATDLGIMVGHVPDYCEDEVSSHAIGLLLNCVRRLTSTQRRMEQGGWDVHRTEPIWRTAGKTLGLIGFGKIAQAVARKLSSWGLSILAVDPFADAEVAKTLGVELRSLESVCRESDYLSVHAPLLPETRHLLNADTFGWMKQGMVLVNTARGPLVDTGALLRALDGGRVAQAALDVFETEPLPGDSMLRRHERILVTDHVAWYSEESQQQLQRSAAEEVVRVGLGGLPRNVANIEVLEKLGRFDEWTPSVQARWQLRRREALARPHWVG